MLQERVRAGVARLAWSYALDHECSLNPFGDRLEAILRWRGLASINVGSSEAVLTLAADFMRGGLMVFDALHVACAVAAGADVFVTTDDRLLRKLKQVQSLPALLPGGAIARLEGWYEN